MTPWAAAIVIGKRAGGIDLRIPIKLVVPKNVIERSVVHLVEGCPDRVRRRVTQAVVPTLGGTVFAARKDELQPYRAIRKTGIATEGTGSLCACATSRENTYVQLECKPPVDLMASRQQRLRRLLGRCGGCDEEKPNSNPQAEHCR